jgi:DNA-binding response OmpR family regulator
MRVLILDDQPGLAQVLALGLRMEGFSVAACTSPHEALKAMGDVDVLVTDYHMPEMTGPEMARRAYAQGWKGSLLIMSGHSPASSESIEDSLVWSILKKPFSTRELAERLRNLA